MGCLPGREAANARLGFGEGTPPAASHKAELGNDFALYLVAPLALQHGPGEPWNYFSHDLDSTTGHRGDVVQSCRLMARKPASAVVVVSRHYRFKGHKGLDCPSFPSGAGRVTALFHTIFGTVVAG